MSWTISTKNGYAYAITTDALATINSTQVESDTIPYDLGEGVAFLGIEVGTGCNDVAANLVLQASPDDATWVTVATLANDTTPNVAGTYMYMVSTLSIAAPYYRLVFNANAQATGTAGRIKFIFNKLIAGSAEARMRSI